MIPPNKSGLSRLRIDEPKRIPKRLPITPNKKLTMPIAHNGKQSSPIEVYPVQAKEMPTASASILVATANTNCVLILVGLKCLSSLSSKIMISK